MIRALLLLLFVAAGCDDGPSPAIDAAPYDAGSDVGPDASQDAAADARPDRALDAAPDAGPDGAPDAGPDGAPDAALDSASDAAPDAIPDAERRDVGSPFRDAAPVEPVEPCTLFECACEPGTEVPCYPGPDGTEGVGVCVGGSQTCAADGLGFGPCEGARAPVGEDCRTPEDEDCDGETPPCSDTWLHTYAAAGNQAVRSVAVAPGGDVLVLLDFDHSVDLGAGALVARQEAADAGLARYDRQGNPVWSRSWGDAAHDFAGQLAVGPAGEVAALVRFYGSLPIDGGFLDSDGLDDMALIVLEPDGAHRWHRRIGGVGRDGSERLAFDAEGRVLLTGRFSERVRFGQQIFASAGLGDVFVAVFEGADGAQRLARQAGGVGEDIGRAVAAGPDGTLYVAGRFEAIISWGGEPIVSDGLGDVFITALEADGAHRWTRHLGGPGDDGLYDMALDPETGALFAFGWFAEAFDYGGEAPLQSAGSADYFVLRIDPDGAVTAAAAFGDAGDQTNAPFPTSSYGALDIGPDGLYLAGPFGGGLFGQQAVSGVDGFAARLDRDLTPRASMAFGTEFTEMALDVAVDPDDGAVVIGGRFYSMDGPVIGPFGPLRGMSLSDGFVVRLPPLEPIDGR